MHRSVNKTLGLRIQVSFDIYFKEVLLNISLIGPELCEYYSLNRKYMSNICIYIDFSIFPTKESWVGVYK